VTRNFQFPILNFQFEMNTFIEQYLPLIKRNFLPLALGFIGLIFLSYGLISLLTSKNSQNQVVFEPGNPQSTSGSASVTLAQIVVDMEGAVVRPGVYKLNQDARIQNALISAGGLSAKADREWVNKNLNLASKLNDGAKIYIPAAGENYTSSNSVLGVQATQNSSGVVNVNSASLAELDNLPGVGTVTAQKIINGRPYKALNELLDKKIVSSKVFSQIKDKISIY